MLKTGIIRIVSMFSNQRWYRNINKKLSEKLLKLHEFGMLIKVGKTESGANVYGINYGVEDFINNIEPNWSSSSIKAGVDEFHRKYPSLVEEFDEFITSASYSLPKNNVYDLIIRFCFVEGIYKLKDVNELLDSYNCKLCAY